MQREIMLKYTPKGGSEAIEVTGKTRREAFLNLNDEIKRKYGRPMLGGMLEDHMIPYDETEADRLELPYLLD